MALPYHHTTHSLTRLHPISFPYSQAPNLPCFVSRIASHPDRLQNMYFNLVLLLRAVSRAGPYLEAYDVATGDAHFDLEARNGLRKVVETAQGGEEGRGEVFDEGGMFKGEDALVSPSSRRCSAYGWGLSKAVKSLEGPD